MRTSPDIALIIPCYNHARSLERAVRSGLSQSNLTEIIIVDDGSTDDSLAVAHGISDQNPIVKVVRMQKNGGAGAARNLGIRRSVASHVCFLDADDELKGDFFADAVKVLATNSGIRVVKGEMEFFDPVKGYILPDFDPRHSAAVLSSSCGTVVERRVVEGIGGFPEDPAFRGPFGGEDVAFMQALIQRFQPIGRVDRPCYRVWSSEDSHVDRFLARTRQKDHSFEFVLLGDEQTPGGTLQKAIAAYLSNVENRLDSMKEGALQKDTNS